VTQNQYQFQFQISDSVSVTQYGLQCQIPAAVSSRSKTRPGSGSTTSPGSRQTCHHHARGRGSGWGEDLHQRDPSGRRFQETGWRGPADNHSGFQGGRNKVKEQTYFSGGLVGRMSSIWRFKFSKTQKRNPLSILMIP
jgi:hypothetical protein